MTKLNLPAINAQLIVARAAIAELAELTAECYDLDIELSIQEARVGLTSFADRVARIHLAEAGVTGLIYPAPSAVVFGADTADVEGDAFAGCF